MGSINVLRKELNASEDNSELWYGCVAKVEAVLEHGELCNEEMYEVSEFLSQLKLASGAYNLECADVVRLMRESRRLMLTCKGRMN